MEDKSNTQGRRELLMQCLQVLISNGFIQNNRMQKKDARKFYRNNKNIPKRAPPFGHFLCNLSGYNVIKKQEASDVIVFNECKLNAFINVNELNKEESYTKPPPNKIQLQSFQQNKKIIKSNQKKSVHYIVVEMEEGHGNSEETVYYPLNYNQLLLNILNISAIPIMIKNIDSQPETIITDKNIVQMTNKIQSQGSIDIILDFNLKEISNNCLLKLIIKYVTKDGDEMVLEKELVFKNNFDLSFTGTCYKMHLLRGIKAELKEDLIKFVVEPGAIKIINNSSNVIEIFKIIPTNLSIIEEVNIRGTTIIQPGSCMEVDIKVITEVTCDFQLFVYVKHNDQESCLLKCFVSIVYQMKTIYGRLLNKSILDRNTTNERNKLSYFKRSLNFETGDCDNILEKIRRSNFETDILEKIKTERKWWKYQNKEIVIEVVKNFGHLPETIWCKFKENQILVNVVNLSKTSVTIEKMIPLYNDLEGYVIIEQLPNTIKPKSKIDVFIKVIFYGEVYYDYPMVFFVKCNEERLCLVKRVRFIYRTKPNRSMVAPFTANHERISRHTKGMKSAVKH